jgi:hypothetical protein
MARWVNVIPSAELKQMDEPDSVLSVEMTAIPLGPEATEVQSLLGTCMGFQTKPSTDVSNVVCGLVELGL